MKKFLRTDRWQHDFGWHGDIEKADLGHQEIVGKLPTLSAGLLVAGLHGGLDLSADDEGLEVFLGGLEVAGVEAGNGLELFEELAVEDAGGGDALAFFEDQLVRGDSENPGELGDDVESGRGLAALVAAELPNPEKSGSRLETVQTHLEQIGWCPV